MILMRYECDYHPDKGGDPDKIKEINLAYEILSNSEKRELYDRYGLEGVRNGGGGGGGGFEDLFDILGGGGRKKNRGGQREKPKMKPTGKEISVKLEDIYTGKMMEITHKRTVLCEDCSGSGGTGVKRCNDCDGQGAVIKTMQIGPGMYQRAQVACTKCKGKGEIIDPANICKTCKGNKTAQSDKKIQISIEPGTPTDHIVKLVGEGDEHPDAQAGDLMIKVGVNKHPIYERKGADLLLQKEVSLKEALLGFSFNIPFLDGKKITISSLPGEVTVHGDVKTVKGKGLPFYKDMMNHGNLIVAFKVKFPDFKQLSQENRGNTGPADKAKNPEYLLDFDPADANSNAAGGNRQEEDDEDGERQGGGRQECVVQ